MHLRLSRASFAVLALTAAWALLPAPEATSQTTAAEPQTKEERDAAQLKKKADKKADSAKNKMGKALKSGGLNDQGTYVMAGDELTMDCKKLTGVMQVTIGSLRGARTRSDSSSSTGQSAHNNIAPLFGGSSALANRQATLARDRAKLDAYNKALASKNCKTVDIDAELARAADGPTKY
jgi:hypothetical protein